MIERRRRRSTATSTRQPSNAGAVSQKVQNELLAQIAAGARSFEIGDPSPEGIRAFQDQVRALEALAAAGMITIGAREMGRGEANDVVAVRRIRLTEAGKRRNAASRGVDPAD